MSRRNFLKLAGAVIGGIATGELSKLAMDRRLEYLRYLETHDSDPVLAIDFDRDNEHLSFEELTQLHRKLGKAFVDLDLEHWRPHLTDEFVRSLVKETAEQLFAEGIATNPANLPPLDEFDPETKLSVSHQLGNTDCTKRVSETSRFTNPASDLYDSPDRSGEIIHETVHFVAQGGTVCHGGDFTRENIEATAQMGMLEILAVMIARGNRRMDDLVLRTFVYESYSLVDGALEFIALRDHRLPEFEQIQQETQSSAFAQIFNAKRERDWASNPFEIEDILEKYYLLPVEMMVNAHRANHDIIENVALPRRYNSWSYYSDTTGSPAVLDIRDWADVMGRLDNLVNQAATEKSQSK